MLVRKALRQEFEEAIKNKTKAEAQEEIFVISQIHKILLILKNAENLPEGERYILTNEVWSKLTSEEKQEAVAHFCYERILMHRTTVGYCYYGNALANIHADSEKEYFIDFLRSSAQTWFGEALFDIQEKNYCRILSRACERLNELGEHIEYSTPSHPVSSKDFIITSSDNADDWNDFVRSLTKIFSVENKLPAVVWMYRPKPEIMNEICELIQKDKKDFQDDFIGVLQRAKERIKNIS